MILSVFILTDNKNYVMENPMKSGDYISTTSPIQATEFTYKQAQSLRQRRGKKFSWMRDFQMVNVDTGETAKVSSYYKGNAGAFIGENDINFDESILDKITNETNAILGLAGWDMTQLQVYKNELISGLSKYDSAEQDITHVLEKYEKDHNGKKPQAHKMAKLGYLLEDIRVMRRRIKQCLSYVQVMTDAITYKYDIGKIRLELSKAEHGEYKGRTEYYEIALNILGNGGE